MLEAVIAKGGDEPFPHYARALELRSLGRLAESVAAFESIAKRFSTYVPTYLMAAQVCEELERIEEASQWAERGIEVAETANDAHAASELRAFLDDL